MVGSAIKNELALQGYHNIVGLSRAACNLEDHNQAYKFFERTKPEFVFLAAAKVGGIKANNTYPADFITSNLLIQNNVITLSHDFNVKKLFFFGSSCIYPKFASQPIKESEFMAGALEPTNDAYAIAKIAGIKMCQAYRDQYDCNFISVMPTNLYGLGDTYDEMNSHVLPALIKKFHEAKTKGLTEVKLWGNGTAKREFLYAGDLAKAAILLMRFYEGRDIINIGSGTELRISKLASMVASAVGYKGKILFDKEAIDGTPRKVLNSKRIYSLGWKPKMTFENGLKIVYQDFLKCTK